MFRVTSHWLTQFKPKTKQYKHDSHNLSVVVNPTGKVSIAFYFKQGAEGKQHRVPLGSYVGKPEKALIEEMNTAYQKLLVEVAQGIDVVESREFAKAEAKHRASTGGEALDFGPLPVEYTFRGAARRYCIDFKSNGKATWSQEQGYVKKIVEGFGKARGVGHLPPDSITAPQLQRILDAVKQEHPATANHVKKTCSRLWLWMKRQGLVDNRELVLDLDAKSPPPRNRLFTEAEMRKLVTGCHQYYLAIVLNPLRLAEHARMSWDMVDSDGNAKLVVKSEDSREHVQPLTDAYMQCSRTYESREGYLFTGNHGYSHINPSSLSLLGTAWGRKNSIPDHHNHDWRSACFSWGERHGVAERVLHSVLAHKKGGLAGVYGLYQFIDERRDYLEEWAGYILWLRREGPTPFIMKQAEAKNKARLKKKGEKKVIIKF